MIACHPEHLPERSGDKLESDSTANPRGTRSTRDTRDTHHLSASDHAATTSAPALVPELVPSRICKGISNIAIHRGPVAQEPDFALKQDGESGLLFERFTFRR